MDKLEKACLAQILTVAETCNLLGISRKRVTDLIASGVLIGRKSDFGNIWLISKGSVERRIAWKITSK